jgi:hypothetical protein
MHQIAEALAWASRVLRDLIRRPQEHTLGTGGSLPREDGPAGLEATWGGRHWGPLMLGVEVINFELRTHSLLEAAAAIGQAWLLVSVQGSQSFNVVFARRGAAFIEIVPSLDAYPTSNHAFLRALGLRVWVLPARGVAHTAAASLVPLVVEIPAVLRAAFHAFDVHVAAAGALILRRPRPLGAIRSTQRADGGATRGSVLCRFEVAWVALHMDLLDREMCPPRPASPNDPADPIDPLGPTGSVGPDQLAGGQGCAVTVSLHVDGSEYASAPLGARPACEERGRFVVDLPAMRHPLSLVARATALGEVASAEARARQTLRPRGFGWAGVESEAIRLLVDPCS